MRDIISEMNRVRAESKLAVVWFRSSSTSPVNLTWTINILPFFSNLNLDDGFRSGLVLYGSFHVRTSSEQTLRVYFC